MRLPLMDEKSKTVGSAGAFDRLRLIFYTWWVRVSFCRNVPNMMVWSHLNKYRDLGLLLLRVFFGAYMAFGHGLGKMTGGPEKWAQLGGVMDMIGLGFLPTFWGFMAALAEFVGALLVAIGVLTRPAALLLTINMAVAAAAHLTGIIDGSAEMALLYGVVFLSFVFVGPGKYSVDELLD